MVSITPHRETPSVAWEVAVGLSVMDPREYFQIMKLDFCKIFFPILPNHKFIVSALEKRGHTGLVPSLAGGGRQTGEISRVGTDPRHSTGRSPRIDRS